MKWTAVMEATLSERTFDRLRSLICERTGICFRDNKRYLLESRVRLRLAACEVTSYEAYVRYLEQEDDPNELMQLINAVTINETSFFRHPAQFDALEQELLPRLVTQRQREGKQTVRLWSAACSAGDEAYTLAIIIRERVQKRFPRMKFEIVGTDIDTEVLAAARAGRYRARAVRNVPTAYLHKFFNRNDETYVLDPVIRQMVTFKRLNLADQQAMQRMRGFDIIMCANVLIYFDAPAKNRVLQALRFALHPGGYLFVGGSETLGDTAGAFVPVRSEGAIAYRRPQRKGTSPGTNGSSSSASSGARSSGARPSSNSTAPGAFPYST